MEALVILYDADKAKVEAIIAALRSRFPDDNQGIRVVSVPCESYDLNGVRRACVSTINPPELSDAIRQAITPVMNG